ncbi:uncharacterized protein [Rutidosis leptorrhynchoides]|uniref:uncharacterized protein n=1 Tax=Rutidosis leptorrhynchoides TaxID=125765 RepID=UPI003A9A230B
MAVVEDSSSTLSFRELDDVFLQSQARIWLGEVLHTRFDEQLSICDLLSDGELLFEVSKSLWNMLLVKYMELNNFKASRLIPIDTRKSSGRYRPYSNVDSFLKVCKVLGLSGVDLFSPSDVVEKKDTRKVCICIRSLSKKARSKQLNVPDFDIVTKTVTMSTDVVRCIRKSLEFSTSKISLGQSITPRLKSRQKSSFGSHKQEDESYLEESDEEKSNNSDSPYADFLFLESGESHNMVEKYAPTHELQQAENRNREIDKISRTPGSAESLFMQYVSSDNHVDEISSPVCESRLINCDEFTPINREAKFWHDIGENALVSSHKRGEVDHHISLSDSISFRILTNIPFHIPEDCLCQSCIATESHHSNTTPGSSMCRNMSSVVGQVLDFDIDFKSNPNDLINSVSSSCDMQQHGSKRFGKLSGLCKQSELEVLDLSGDAFSQYLDDAKSYSSVDQDVESVNQSDVVHSYDEDKTKAATKDEREDASIDCLAEANTNGVNEKNTVKTEKKSTYIAPLLKTVAKGSALIGVLFLLHLRIIGTNKSIGKSTQIHWKSSGVLFSRRKGENGSKIYPTDKLLL